MSDLGVYRPKRPKKIESTDFLWYDKKRGRGEIMVNILIVEDSNHDMDLYKKAIIPQADVNLFYSKSAEEALHVMRDNKIDIFFLDIELPGMSGFELAGKIRAVPAYSLTYIVFITGYSQNQLDAFKEFHCYDYIVKPFTAEEFASKLNTLIGQVAVVKKKTERTKLATISALDGDYLVRSDDICFAESQRNSCTLHMTDKTQHFKGITLKELIQNVNEEYFLRCHKSYAVNVKKIFCIREVNYRLWSVSFHDSDQTIDLSKSFYQGVMEKYKQLSGFG